MRNVTSTLFLQYFQKKIICGKLLLVLIWAHYWNCFFYSQILANNNLSLKIYCEILWKYCGSISQIWFTIFYFIFFHPYISSSFFFFFFLLFFLLHIRIPTPLSIFTSFLLLFSLFFFYFTLEHPTLSLSLSPLCVFTFVHIFLLLVHLTVHN